MNIYNNLRSQAKLDSRRFGKGIVCEIVRGTILDFVLAKNLGPRQVFFNEYGVDVINLSLLVIPTVKYKDIEDMSLTLDIPTSDEDSIEVVDSIIQKTNDLIKIIQQNIILVTIESSSLDGSNYGKNPEYYNILIDSMDVNQTIMGRYVPKTATNIRSLGDF